MEVRYNVLRRIVLCVVKLKVESIDRELMPALVVVSVGKLSETMNRTEVRLEAMLSLGQIHRVQQ